MRRPPPCATQTLILLFLLMGAWAGEVNRCYHPGLLVGWGLLNSERAPAGMRVHVVVLETEELSWTCVEVATYGRGSGLSFP